MILCGMYRTAEAVSEHPAALTPEVRGYLTFSCLPQPVRLQRIDYWSG
jgi:hypothetical protein